MVEEDGGDVKSVSYKYNLPLDMSNPESPIARADPSADMSTENPKIIPSSPMIVSPTIS